MGKYLLEEVGTLQWLFDDELVRDTCSLASIMLITLSYIPVPQSCPLLVVCRKLPNSRRQPDAETTFSNPSATNRFTRSALASDSRRCVFNKLRVSSSDLSNYHKDEYPGARVGSDEKSGGMGVASTVSRQRQGG